MTTDPGPGADAPTVRALYHAFLEVFVLLEGGDRAVLGALGLTPSQYRALRLLDPKSGLRQTELAERLLLDKSTVTRLIHSLEDAALVRRVPDPNDGRALRILITKAGASLCARAEAAHDASLRRRLEALDAQEQAQLYGALDRLRAHLMEDFT